MSLFQFGLENEVDGHGSDPFYRLQFLARILKDKVGHGAGGSRHGHVDGKVAVVAEVDAVNQAETVDVDRYFRVEHCLEHRHHFFFEFQMFFCVHKCRYIYRVVLSDCFV